MRQAHKGKFYPKNPKKYIGSKTPIYRSSWEWTFMQLCDNNDNISEWSSEPVRIPYRNPLTGKFTVYVPDFLIRYIDKKNRMHVELIEIKPKKETHPHAAKTLRDKARLAVNTAKWQAATRFAENHGMKFRVITEEDIFTNV